MTDLPISIPMLNSARLHVSLLSPLRNAFDRVVQSGRFVGGDEVSTFETRTARMFGVTRVVGTSSGTDALMVALSALGALPGDEVITTTFSFFSSAGAIARLGATPVFIDIDPETFNIDPTGISAAVSSRTVGVLPVHLFGRFADMPAVMDVARACGVWVLEDAAQAIGARKSGRFAGTVGNAGAVSFFPAKNLGALGDAGAVLTNDEILAERMLALRNHGAKERYVHEFVGGNFRLDALQAAFLSVKLPYLEQWQTSRRRIATTYREALRDVEEIRLPATDEDGGSVWNQFVLRAKRRDELRAFLRTRGIETAVYYPFPLHLQPCFARLGYRPGMLPHAERAAAEVLALPVDPLLTRAEQAAVVDGVVSFYETKH